MRCDASCASTLLLLLPPVVAPPAPSAPPSDPPWPLLAPDARLLRALLASPLGLPPLPCPTALIAEGAAVDSGAASKRVGWAGDAAPAGPRPSTAPEPATRPDAAAQAWPGADGETLGSESTTFTLTLRGPSRAAGCGALLCEPGIRGGGGNMARDGPLVAMPKPLALDGTAPPGCLLPRLRPPPSAPTRTMFLLAPLLVLPLTGVDASSELEYSKI